jgi:RNA polymerase sigma factor (sigma-70 family)
MSPWLSDLFLRSQSDERLASLAGAGESRAFGVIAERYRRELQSYARRFDEQRAEDLVQQTFLAAFTALQSGTEARHLRGWLYQILRHAALRAALSNVPAVDDIAADAVADSAQETAERRMLAVDALAAVAELPRRQRDAFVQSAIQGRSRAEIASVMGLSDAAVRQLVHRARSALRTSVTALTPMPVARWMASLGSGTSAGLQELAAGGGAASAGALTLKLGALVATGVVATGVAVTGVIPQASHSHRDSDRSVAASAQLLTPGHASRAEHTGAPQLTTSGLGRSRRAAGALNRSAGRRHGDRLGGRSDGSGSGGGRDGRHSGASGSGDNGGSSGTSGSSDGSSGSSGTTESRDRSSGSSSGSSGSTDGSSGSTGDSSGSGATVASGRAGSSGSSTTTTTTTSTGGGGGSDGGNSGSTATTATTSSGSGSSHGGGGGGPTTTTTTSNSGSGGSFGSSS